MNAAILVLTLLSAEEQVVVPAPEPVAVPDKPLHYGIGARFHSGLMESQGAPYLYLQSEITFFITLRAFDKHEFRAGVGLAAGWPDTLAGESNVSLRFNLTRHFSIGVGTNAFWSFWSMRGGLEVPFAIRLGENRRHEISLTLRGTAGVFNGSTFAWWDFKHQHAMFGGDAVLGYSAIF